MAQKYICYQQQSFVVKIFLLNIVLNIERAANPQSPYETMGDYANSEKCFATAAKWNPANGYARFLHAATMARNGITDSALEELAQAGKLRDFGAIHYLAGEIYAGKGELTEQNTNGHLLATVAYW